MNNSLIWFLFYLSGWVILSICFYIYKVYIDKDIWTTKKLHCWRSFWHGIFSWFGIIIVGSFLIVGLICAINDWVEDKLNT